MGIFDKLFNKKERESSPQKQTAKETVMLEKDDLIISAGDDIFHKVTRPLTEAQRVAIEQSTILLQVSQLYMHYWTADITDEFTEDQEWQNKVMYFWKADEPFAKKSLPSEFETFEKRYFLFESASGIEVLVGKAAPWFGQPGLGDKHVCKIDGRKVIIPELKNKGMVTYVKPVTLTESNLDVLNKRDDYFFLVDERITPFQNGNFHLNGNPVPIDVAYSIGGIHLMQKT